MREEGKSENTIKSYSLHLKGYMDWYEGTFGMPFVKLYRQNILEYKSYLINVKEQDAKTINAKLSALVKLNEHLITEGVQSEVVLTRKDYVKVQTEFASPAKISKKDVEAFRQRI
ncbi:phage integrase N-terminal SAM-like domain-containing protein, partial [Escherichia coli]|uniref:phage integrase N-terminal SAM-like domain-containing protein n=1 Tax=Escherichia coli TaxID=562 RepID=UPI00202BABFA